MADYVTDDQIKAEIPEPDLIDALDDDKDGLMDDEALAQVIATASMDVDALLAARYVVPFDPVPSVVAAAAFVFAGEKIYARRRALDDKNPFSRRATFWRERLAKIGDGSLPLDAGVAETNAAAWGSGTKIASRLDDE